MINKETTPVDPHDYFSNATQVVVTTIEKELNRYGYASPNLKDMLYFCYIFLKLILIRLDANKRDMLSHHLREVFQMASEDGKNTCNIMMSSKIDTHEGRSQAIQTMIANLKGSGNLNSELFLDVAKHVQSLGMTNDGLWKLDDHLPYTSVLEKDIEANLNKLIDEKISEAYQIDIKRDNHETPELAFLICAAINTGIMMGYVSVLYHQSADEMIDAAIKQINQVMAPHEDKVQ